MGSADAVRIFGVHMGRQTLLTLFLLLKPAQKGSGHSYSCLGDFLDRLLENSLTVCLEATPVSKCCYQVEHTRKGQLESWWHPVLV